MHLVSVLFSNVRIPRYRLVSQVHNPLETLGLQEGQTLESVSPRLRRVPGTSGVSGNFVEELLTVWQVLAIDAASQIIGGDLIGADLKELDVPLGAGATGTEHPLDSGKLAR